MLVTLFVKEVMRLSDTVVFRKFRTYFSDVFWRGIDFWKRNNQSDLKVICESLIERQEFLGNKITLKRTRSLLNGMCLKHVKYLSTNTAFLCYYALQAHILYTL